ncbi:MAG: transposase, partial [Pseudomonadota bacterium]
MVDGKRKGRTNVIGAYSCEKGLFAAQTYETMINKKAFVDWIKEHLLQHLKAGMTVIMDNAPWHKGDDIQELIESTGARLLKLPPYSPDLNPIEKAWANLKNAIKKAKKTISDIGENINMQIHNMKK